MTGSPMTADAVGLFGEAFVNAVRDHGHPGLCRSFLALTGPLSPRERARAARSRCWCLVVIVAFAVFGQQILDYLHVSLPAAQGCRRAVAAAGGAAVADRAGGRHRRQRRDQRRARPAGTPLLAGPGAIVATMC